MTSKPGDTEAEPRPVKQGKSGKNVATTKVKRLGLPSPVWDATEDDMRQAVTSCQARKMRYNGEDVEWILESSTEIHHKLNKELHELHQRQGQLKKLIAASYSSSSKPQTRHSAEDPKLVDTCASTVPEVGAFSEAGKNENAGAAEVSDAVQDLKAEAREIRTRIANATADVDLCQERSLNIRLEFPNRIHPETPIGSESKAIVESISDPNGLLPEQIRRIETLGGSTRLTLESFPPGPPADPERDHISVAAALPSGSIDLASGNLATGPSWPFLTGTLTLLEHALSQYAISIALKKGFVPVSTPDAVRTEVASRCGFRPRDAAASQTYFLNTHKSESRNDTTSDAEGANDLCLAGTAEIPLAALLANRVFELKPPKSVDGSKAPPGKLDQLPQEHLPLKLIALGHAFRAEAGARGADTRGLYRVHQFTKAEMFVVTEGRTEVSDAMLEELRRIQEEIITGLGLGFRVLNMPSEELGASAYRKYDIEVWMPGRGSWGEVSSASNCTDYQSRRLNIKHSASVTKGGEVDKRGAKPVFAHTLNATAAAVPRLIVALLENYGTSREGRLVLPSSLKPFWLGGPEDKAVEWITGRSTRDDEVPLPSTKGRRSSKDGAIQKAMERVRAMAERQGTDPASMGVSFLILHEVTALVPLIALFYLFGALGAGEAVLDWLVGGGENGEQRYEGEQGGVSGLVVGTVRGWVGEGMVRAERYGKRKGYFGFEKEEAEGSQSEEGRVGITDEASLTANGKGKALAGSFANAVAAYAVVKALLPLRIAASVALAGRFSRVFLEPVKRLTRGFLRRGSRGGG
ncbi:seryl-tRNA synthetase [Violaceomyces palustris]|uniref:Seryl-tRNA synthetase n=1 Tax=Violaceomyces palustris TaxID=1673888 RepID=A0ACD0NYR3_9BASI|nr:seryl-tRNA synthetase [Violaceomyces palustris]